MVKLEGRDCFLFAYYLAAITIMQQLPSFVDLKKTHICLQTSYNFCLLFVVLLDTLWLLPIV
jgi:hypothetical protein